VTAVAVPAEIGAKRTIKIVTTFHNEANDDRKLLVCICMNNLPFAQVFYSGRVMGKFL
jgi:hypothetical protein